MVLLRPFFIQATIYLQYYNVNRVKHDLFNEFIPKLDVFTGF